LLAAIAALREDARQAAARAAPGAAVSGEAERRQLRWSSPRARPGWSCEARGEPVGAALTPSNGLPRFCRQTKSERLGGDRLVLVVAPQQLGWSSAAPAALRRQRPRARRPNRGVGTDNRQRFWREFSNLGKPRSRCCRPSLSRKYRDSLDHMSA
jgi:hypothetical protein